MKHDTDPEFVHVRIAAARLGVPVAWLRRQCEADQLPSIVAGRQRLVRIESVRDVLDQLARQRVQPRRPEKMYL